ncbi:MAG: DsbE family thiol:disulfide interchange protein [Gammaproteobacteria bacterium]|nr:DsbE family thiol:disulfide interchange protein [Gammaproteobacteria bacterium]
MWRYLLPLGLFVVLVIFLSMGLSLNPRDVPSPLLGKPAPEFNLADLHNEQQKVSPAQYKGQVWLLNVWASWCVSCRAEHPVLNQLATKYKLKIVGLNYKDQRADGINWLQQRGNPYIANGFDFSGRAGIDWGVYGVPETFVIDKRGHVRYKHTGPVGWQDIEEKIMPLVQQLMKETAE